MISILLTHRLSKGTKRFLRELLKPASKAGVEITMAMYVVKADAPDVGLMYTYKVTDSEGNEITDPAVLGSLQEELTTSDPVVVEVAKTAPGAANVHFGSPGIAQIALLIKTADGTILGSGSADITVVTGDPSAVTNLSVTIDGLEPAPEPQPVP